MASSLKQSETSSVLKARAAAREAKLQIEMEALKRQESLEREELTLQQRREEQERTLRRGIEEKQRAVKEQQRAAEEQQRVLEEQQRVLEEQQQALEKSRDEELSKMKMQSQKEEWEIMNRKRVLQKELDLKCAAVEIDIIDKVSERSFSASGSRKYKTSTKS